MKHLLTLGTVLILIITFFITGCDNPPPPVTDFDSFIENLRYAGATVNATYIERDATSFTESYLNFHYEAIKRVQKSGKVIEPEFLEAELNRLSKIKEQANNIEMMRTEINLYGATAQIREYNREEAADSDAAYIALLKEEDFIIPTDKGEEYIVISPLAIKLHAYKKGRIIVEYLEGYSSLSEDKNILDLLESLLGPPFYVEN